VLGSLVLGGRCAAEVRSAVNNARDAVMALCLFHFLLREGAMATTLSIEGWWRRSETTWSDVPLRQPHCRGIAKAPHRSMRFTLWRVPLTPHLASSALACPQTALAWRNRPRTERPTYGLYPGKADTGRSRIQ